MMDIQKMSEEALRKLNKEIVAEIRYRIHLKSTEAARQFRLGDPVSFMHRDKYHTGVIKRCNPKTASVKCEGEPMTWKVPWRLLTVIVKAPLNAMASK